MANNKFYCTKHGKAIHYKIPEKAIKTIENEEKDLLTFCHSLILNYHQIH